MKKSTNKLFLLSILSFGLLISCGHNAPSNIDTSSNEPINTSSKEETLSQVSNNTTSNNETSSTPSSSSESSEKITSEVISSSDVSSEDSTIPVEHAPVDVFISEFFNLTYHITLNPLGGNQDKAIELYNPTDSPIDLSSYKIECYSNGQTTPKDENYIINLSGTINPNSTYVIAQKWAGEGIISRADLILDINIGLPIGAKSSLGLYKNNKLIDVFGEIGRSYGSNDEFVINGVNSAADTHNVIRCPNYTNNLTFTEKEWEVRFDNDFSSLGFHNFDGNTLPPVSELENPDDVLFELIYNISETPVEGDLSFPTEYKGYTFTYDYTACSYYYDKDGKLKETPSDGFCLCYYVSIYSDGKLIKTAYDGYFYYKVIPQE